MVNWLHVHHVFWCSPAGRPGRRGSFRGRPRVMGSLMSWLILVLAGLLEVVWAVGLKYTHGFTRLWPSVGTLGAMLVSFVLLAQAMKTLPMGTAYAVWVGIGAVGAGIVGVVVLGEPANAGRVVSLALIVVGVIGLKLAST